jgi:hypothetical protein
MRVLFSAIACLSLLVCGLVHGFWTDRWTASPALAEACKRMEQLPLQLGDWKGEALAVTPDQLGANVAGCIQRRYTNQRTGETVVLALVCGRAGPVSIHTPEVCYGASGYRVDPPRKERLFEAREEEAVVFWTADAVQTRTTETTRIRIFWGWNAGQGWQASDNPRLHFARQPVLYKLYVLRELEGPADRPRPDPCERLLQVLLPALKNELFASPGERSTS